MFFYKIFRRANLLTSICIRKNPKLNKKRINSKFKKFLFPKNGTIFIKKFLKKLRLIFYYNYLLYLIITLSFFVSLYYMLLQFNLQHVINNMLLFSEPEVLNLLLLEPEVPRFITRT